MTEHRLYLGRKFTGIAVKSDDQWPTMYRIHWPDLPPSDLVNLSRAKDAAMRWAGRHGGSAGFGLKWIAAKQGSGALQTG
jgi:hypothetical protein